MKAGRNAGFEAWTLAHRPQSPLSASTSLAEWREEMNKELMIQQLEQQVGAREKPDWIERLRAGSRIWMWQP